MDHPIAYFFYLLIMVAIIVLILRSTNSSESRDSYSTVDSKVPKYTKSEVLNELGVLTQRDVSLINEYGEVVIRKGAMSPAPISFLPCERLRLESCLLKAIASGNSAASLGYIELAEFVSDPEAKTALEHIQKLDTKMLETYGSKLHSQSIKVYRESLKVIDSTLDYLAERNIDGSPKSYEEIMGEVLDEREKRMAHLNLLT